MTSSPASSAPVAHQPEPNFHPGPLHAAVPLQPPAHDGGNSQSGARARGEGEREGEGSESEWEYEYSTTENETYYLTVDLSIPDFVQLKDDTIVHNTRAGYRSWFNPMLEKPDLGSAFDNDDDDAGPTQKKKRSTRNDGNKGRRNGRPNRDEYNTDEDDDEEGGARLGGTTTKPRLLDGEDDEAASQRPGSRGSRQGARSGASSKRKGDDEQLQIQIMDLHTEHPVIAHRGMVFTGTWANNIGTELIFTKPFGDGDYHQDEDEDEEEEDDVATADSPEAGTEDDGTPNPSSARPAAMRASKRGRGGNGTAADINRPLPHILSLPGATLLAASSARLLCRPTTLTARDTPAQRREAHRAARAANGFAIHVTDDRTGQRRPQARFLERLAALKRRRGETDEVTVQTVENPDDAVEDDSDEEFERVKKAKKRGYDDVRKRRRRTDRLDKPGRGKRDLGKVASGDVVGETGKRGPGGANGRWWPAAAAVSGSDSLSALLAGASNRDGQVVDDETAREPLL